MNATYHKENKLKKNRYVHSFKFDDTGEGTYCGQLY